MCHRTLVGHNGVPCLYHYYSRRASRTAAVYLFYILCVVRINCRGGTARNVRYTEKSTELELFYLSQLLPPKNIIVIVGKQKLLPIAAAISICNLLSPRCLGAKNI